MGILELIASEVGLPTWFRLLSKKRVPEGEALTARANKIHRLKSGESVMLEASENYIGITFAGREPQFIHRNEYGVLYRLIAPSVLATKQMNQKGRAIREVWVCTPGGNEPLGYFFTPMPDSLRTKVWQIVRGGKDSE